MRGFPVSSEHSGGHTAEDCKSDGNRRQKGSVKEFEIAKQQRRRGGKTKKEVENRPYGVRTEKNTKNKTATPPPEDKASPPFQRGSIFLGTKAK